MSLQDPIADLLTRIRNGQMSDKTFVRVRASKQNAAILDVLKKEGFIKQYTVDKNENPAKSSIQVALSYTSKGSPVIEKIERASKPSVRWYSGCQDLPKVFGGLGVTIVSTNKGVMSDKEARKLGIGGEVICFVA